MIKNQLRLHFQLIAYLRNPKYERGIVLGLANAVINETTAAGIE